MAKRSDRVAEATPNQEGPPPWRSIGSHEMLPEADHDEAARFDFLAQFTYHLATRVMPGNRGVYDQAVLPEFQRTQGRDFEDRHEVRQAMLRHPFHQLWCALRRAAMESRQQAGRMLVLRQQQQLARKAEAFNAEQSTLQLDPELETPRYLAAVDHHCMPGSYHAELAPGDVSAAANYDAGIFVTTGGMLGRYADGGGHGVAAWLREHLPGFTPRRILEIGCGLGHNTLPLAQAFPEAEVTAVDQAAPMLRYGHARARALGVGNIRFVQGNAESLDFPDQSFDWIQSTMMFHETSHRALPAILKEVYRLLAPGGVTLHIEQPQYTEDMDLYEQYMRDWDAYHNNEPYWTKFHELDLDRIMVEAGFRPQDVLHGKVCAVVDQDLFPEAKQREHEDFGRTPSWHLVGARKAGGAPQ